PLHVAVGQQVGRLDPSPVLARRLARAAAQPEIRRPLREHVVGREDQIARLPRAAEGVLATEPMRERYDHEEEGCQQPERSDDDEWRDSTGRSWRRDGRGVKRPVERGALLLDLHEVVRIAML